VTHLREILRRDVIPRRHTALLVAIIITMAVRPLIGDAGFAPAAFSIALLMVLFVALFTIQVDDLVGEREVLLAQRRRRRIVGWTLAAVALTERVVVLFAPSSELYRVGAVSWLLFFAFVTWSQLRSLLKQKEVTNETISMSISVYLLLGLTWGLLFIVIYQFQPEAFNLGGSSGVTPPPQHVFPIIIYFSLTTLSTVGFGDITPLTLQARYAAVAEGIFGQFYLAILVARLVALHMNRTIAEEQAATARAPQPDQAVEGDR
jgi:voltage-gated potassium channel